MYIYIYSCIFKSKFDIYVEVSRINRCQNKEHLFNFPPFSHFGDMLNKPNKKFPSIVGWNKNQGLFLKKKKFECVNQEY